MFIVFYQSNQRGVGYNLTSGGDGVSDLSECARAKQRASSISQWADPAHREKVTRAARNQKPRALEAVAASIDDYGEHAGMGITLPVDFEDRVRVAIHASSMGYQELDRASGVNPKTPPRFVCRECDLRSATLHRLAEALGVSE